MTDPPLARPRPARRMPGAAWAAWLILRGTTWRVALPVALIVGILLSLVNQGSELVRGDVDTLTLLRMAANFVIPYVVSSVGYLGAQLERRPMPASRVR